jgi:hypothetical protein
MRICTILLVWTLAGPASSQDMPGKIAGTISLKGNAPKRKPMQIPCPHCGPLYPAGMPREDLVVDANARIKGAVVFIKSGLVRQKD